MNNMDVDFNQLVQETLNQAINSEEAREFRREFLFEEDDTEPVIVKETEPQAFIKSHKRSLPLSPGIIYKLNKDTFSYSFEFASAKCIDESWQELESLEDFKDSEWSFFETPYIELAEYIGEQILHRRFSSEVSFFNISDPSPSWWLRDEGNKITIHFSVQSEKDDEVIELGPLGDMGLALSRLASFEEIYNSWFSLNKLEVSRRKIAISTFRTENGEHPQGFELFKAVLRDGLNPDRLIELGNTVSNPTLILYLYELSLMRKFWLQVQSELN